MKILALGDVCGEPGLTFFEENIKKIKADYNVDICVVNGENADVVGIRTSQAERFFASGADAVTLGNHSFRRGPMLKAFDRYPYLLRPLNYPGSMPGPGYCCLTLNSGKKLGVINLVGRLDCDFNSDNPFFALDKVLALKEADFYIVDFHAEATSEKIAMAYYADGRASAVFGTHTHVQTSDNRILPKGTGYITDLGMTGARESVIGINLEHGVNRFLGIYSQKFESASGPRKIEGAFFEIDESSGRCVSVERLRIEEEIEPNP